MKMLTFRKLTLESDRPKLYDFVDFSILDKIRVGCTIESVIDSAKPTLL
jgi:hypothetical protein